MIPFKTCQYFVSASITFLLTFLDTFLLSVPSFSSFPFPTSANPEICLQVAHTPLPLPSVHFMYSYFFNLKKNPKQTQHSEDFFKKFIYLICLFLSALGLCCCGRAFSSCGERGLLFVAVRGLLIAVASPVAEQGLQVRGLQ